MSTSDGKVVTLAHYGPGELFGESGFSGDVPREHSVWTTTPAIIANLPMAVFVDALRERPEALLDLNRRRGWRGLGRSRASREGGSL